MDYKKKYQVVMACLWIMTIILTLFSLVTIKTLNKLEKEIKDFQTQQMIQTYIDSGWIPIDTTIKHKTRKLKKEKNND